MARASAALQSPATGSHVQQSVGSAGAALKSPATGPHVQQAIVQRSWYTKFEQRDKDGCGVLALQDMEEICRGLLPPHLIEQLGPLLSSFMEDDPKTGGAVIRYRSFLQWVFELPAAASPPGGASAPRPLPQLAPALRPPPLPSPVDRQVTGNVFAILPGLGDREMPGFSAETCPESMPDLSQHCSFTAEVLRGNPSIYNSLKRRKTKHGSSFAKCIKICMDNPTARITGITAGDADAYETFCELFIPVLQMCNGGTPLRALPSAQRQDTQLSSVSTVPIDPTGKYAVMVRVEARRNLQGLPFPPACGKEDRRMVETILTAALTSLGKDSELFPGFIPGDYFPLQNSTSYAPKPSGMTPEDEAELHRLHFLFHEPQSKVDLSSGIGRHWPDARGVFADKARQLLGWVNEEDHLRLISLQRGGNLRIAFDNCIKALQSLETSLQRSGQSFARHTRLGFLTSAPTHVGTALTATVTLRIPLAAGRPGFSQLCKSLRLEAITGPESRGLWQITTADGIGCTEAAMVNTLVTGCAELVNKEIALEKAQQPISPSQRQSAAGAPSRPPAEVPGRASAIRPGLGASQGLSDQPSLLASQATEGARRDVVSSHNVFSILPGLGASDFPGFPTDKCPTTMPDLHGNLTIMAEVIQRDTRYERLKELRTKAGVTLARCIKPGMDAPHLKRAAGIVAGDAESYDVFRELFDPIIQARHAAYQPFANSRHPCDLSLGAVSADPIDPDGKYTIMASVQIRRNLEGMPFLPACDTEHLKEVERTLTDAFKHLDGPLSGEYYPLPLSTTHAAKPNGMTADEAARFEDRHVLFHEPQSRERLSAGFGRSWPHARGLYFTSAQNLSIWCNQEDHLRAVSLEPSGNLHAAFARLSKALAVVQDSLKRNGITFAYRERRGYLTACPENLGTGLHASIALRLPLLSSQPGFREMCEKLGLEVHHGVDPLGDAKGIGVWQFSNPATWGRSEAAVVNDVISGCAKLVAKEAALEANSKALGAASKQISTASSPAPGLAPQLAPQRIGHQQELVKREMALEQAVTPAANTLSGTLRDQLHAAFAASIAVQDSESILVPPQKIEGLMRSISAGLSPKELELVLQSLPKSSDGRIPLDDFLTWLCDSK